MIVGSENLIRLRSFRRSLREIIPLTWRREAGDVLIKLQGMRNAKSRPEKQHMAGEPDTSKGVRPVRWGGHRNLNWKQFKALGPYPTLHPRKRVSQQKPPYQRHHPLPQSCQNSKNFITICVPSRHPRRAHRPGTGDARGVRCKHQGGPRIRLGASA